MISHFKKSFSFASIVASIALCSTANAYYSTVDTGELIDQGKYQVSIEPQLVFNRYDGGNVVGRFDTGLSESSAVRGILGVGKVDFEIGALYKWIPFPDVDGQPAIGLEAGATLARVHDQTEFNFRLHPLMSKRFQTEALDMIPYASLPFGITTRGDKSVIPLQLEIGSEFRPLNAPSWSFFAELGLNLNQSFSYVSVAAAYRFSENSFRAR